MKKTLLFVAVSAASLLTLILTGCSKKDGAASISMKSVAGTYKLTSATFAAGGLSGDYMQIMDECERDDLLTLNADSTALYTDAGVQCGNGNGTGKWYISGNYLIQGDDIDGKDTATIKSFNGSALVLVLSGDYNGIAASVTSTLTKQ